MKKALIPIILLMFVTMACALTGGGEVTQPPPTQAVDLQPTEAPSQPPTKEPTEPSSPPTKEPATPPQGEPTEAGSPPEPEPGKTDGYFVEKFDGDLSSWTPFVIAGDTKKEYAEVFSRRLKFELPNSETYAYVENTSSTFQDVYVETEVETIAGGGNGISLFCRGSDQGFYEFRIHTMKKNAGSFEVYRFDFLLRERGKVPYVNLLKDRERLFTQDIKAGLNTNVLGLMCSGDEIRLFINGIEQLPMPGGKTIRDNVLTDGTVGVGAMSFSDGPVHVEFVSVSASAP